MKGMAISPAECAEYLCDPILKGADTPPGLLLIGPKAQEVPKTALHDAARDAVWAHTLAVLRRGGAARV